MSSENGKRVPDWAKGIALIGAMLGTGGGSGWYVSTTAVAQVQRQQTETLHALDTRLQLFEERLSTLTETAKIRDRIREEVRAMVRPESLR